MKITEKIFVLLKNYPELRSSDKKLIWKVWEDEHKVFAGMLTRDQFLTSMNPETITRARRQVQKDNPHLRANKVVREMREKKRQTKGKFIHAVEVKPLKIQKRLL